MGAETFIGCVGKINQYLIKDRMFSVKRKADDDVKDECENDDSGGMMGGWPTKSRLGPTDTAQYQVGETNSKTRKNLRKTKSVGGKVKLKSKLGINTSGSIKEYFNCLEKKSHGSSENDVKEGRQKQRSSVYLLTNPIVKFMNRSNKDKFD